MKLIWFKIVLILVIVTYVCGDRKPGKPPRNYHSEYPEARRNKAAIRIDPSTEESNERPQNDEHPDCAKCLNQKYLQHYEAMRCEPVVGEVICKKPCPKYFKCPDVKLPKNLTECYVGGKSYKIGEKIPLENPCQQCVCVNRNFNENFKNIEPDVVCASVDCPEMINPDQFARSGGIDFPDEIDTNHNISLKNKTASLLRNKKNCYNVYEHGKCCATHQSCPSDYEMRKLKTCKYQDKKYKIGEQIFLKEDSCVVCICDEGWDEDEPTKSRGCTRVKCDLEIDMAKKRGCIPIYHKASCCPIDYHCPSPKEHKCLFDGNYYPIDSKLDIDNNCVTCECLMPPMFTCIQKQCPTPPNPSCTVHYEDGKCCPRIDCPEIKEAEMLPKLNKTLDQGSQCPPWIPGGLACAGYNCITVQDEFGCQACKCERECPELNCGHGCNIYVVTPGECPRCSC